jgi:U2-associated protein SR140
MQPLNPSTSSRQPKLFTDAPQFDQNSTNLFVGNISTKINETKLMEIFGKFGPIASVKIMWPRTPEENQRRNNSGFVCFMKRDDASEALSNLDGTDLMGLNLRIGWGKSVQLPSIPVYDPNHSKTQQLPTNLPFNIAKPPEKKSHNQITIPSDSRQLEVIHKTIERVLDLGASFEQLIMERNSNDPSFAFLADLGSSNHLYYKWKLHSLRQGDSMDEWKSQPFQLFENGPEFLPPSAPIPEPSIDESSDLDSEGNELPGTSKGLLLPRKSKILEKMLNELTLDRDSIGDAMVFLVDNCDAAEETCTAICDLLISDKTDNNHKLALLYVISDTLYNISLEVSGSWKLRTKFETLLPIIFTHFGSVHRGIQSLGRLKAEAFRKRIMTVIPGWERMTFFPQPYLDHLTNLFQHGENYEQILNQVQSTIKQTGTESITQSKDEASEEIDGEPFAESDAENVDGEEFKDDDEDIDGVAYNSDD